MTKTCRAIFNRTTTALLMLAATSAAMGAETFLPMQDISFSGRVTESACQVRLTKENLIFERGLPSAARIQRQTLLLEDCSINEVDILFRAVVNADNPAWGVLKSRSTGQPSADWHFRLAFDPPALTSAVAEDVFLQPAEAERMEKEPARQGMPGEADYFHLNGAPYHFVTRQVPQSAGAYRIPFAVSLHRTPGGNERADDDLEGAFTLQMTYR